MKKLPSVAEGAGSVFDTTDVADDLAAFTSFLLSNTAADCVLGWSTAFVVEIASAVDLEAAAFVGLVAATKVETLEASARAVGAAL